jgi:hypothetical protein
MLLKVHVLWDVVLCRWQLVRDFSSSPSRIAMRETRMLCKSSGYRRRIAREGGKPVEASIALAWALRRAIIG